MNRMIERLNRHIPVNVRKNPLVASLVAVLYRILLHFDSDFRSIMDSAISMCGQSADKRALRRDMLIEFIKASVSPVEYARFEFANKKQEQRRSYIPDFEEVSICKWTKGHNILPDSKYDRYRMFSKYFLRKVLCISYNNDVTEIAYSEFLSSLNKIVCKPLKGTKGHGISIIDSNLVPTLSEFRRRFLGDYLVEEAIQQGDELGMFHPGSINTVRFVTGMDRHGRFRNIFALARIGQGDSIVDNGLVAMIDIVGGVISTDAFRGTTRYSVHPDTNVQFRGHKIPEWEKLCTLVRDIHTEHPGQMVFGFDLAWTKKGWDLVEVNPAPSFDSYQQLTGEGIRPYLKEIEIL